MQFSRRKNQLVQMPESTDYRFRNTKSTEKSN